MITDEEYLERVTPRLSGRFTLPEEVVLPDGEVQVGLLAVDLSAPLLYAESPEVLVSTSVGVVSEGETVDYSMELPLDFDDVEFGELDPDAPGMLGQAWGIGAWSWAEGRPDDFEGFSEEDSYLSAATVKLLAWIVEPQGRYVDELEAQPGFNFLTYDYDSQRVLSVTPVITTGMSWNFGAPLAMTRREGLKVTVSLPGLPARHPRVDIYRTDQFELTQESPYPEPTLLTYGLASSSGTEFIDLVYDFGEPRWDHLTDETPALSGADLGFLIASYAGIAYEDSNEDGEWAGLDGTEAPLGFSVSPLQGDDSYIVACLRPVSFRPAFAVEAGLEMGWQIVKVSDGEPSLATWANGIAVD